MKIACIAMMDNGNWIRHAARGLRDYCHLKATAYAQNPDTYVNVPDKTVERWNGEDYPDADAYLLNDHTYFYHYRYFKDKPRLVKCNGTFARDMGGWFTWDYLKHGTTLLSSPCDYSLARELPFSIQTIGPLYDHRFFPQPVRSETKIVVAHAPTNPFKGTQPILKHLHKHRKKGTIDIDIITDTPYLECLERKSRAHILIDQYTTEEPDDPGTARGAFGINAIEACEFGSIVLNNPLHPYVRHHLNPTPLLDFPDYIPTAIDLAPTMKPNNNQSWARRHFDISQKSYELRDWIERVT